MPEAENKLIAILKYLEEWEKLVRKSVMNVDDYGAGLSAYQHDIEGLPGIDTQLIDDGDEIWLKVSRLSKTPPPNPPDSLKPWIVLKDSANAEPKCRDSIVRPGEGIEDEPKELFCNDSIRSDFQHYVDQIWSPWAEKEASRRESIKLYERLFSLQQTLNNSSTETPIEIVWGMGMVVWRENGKTVRHPLISQQVEILPLEGDMTLRVRATPREPQLELDPFMPLDIVGLAAFESEARAILNAGEVVLSPFDTSTFETICRNAAAQLNTNGIYLPDHSGYDGTIPTVGEDLQITDSWVLFARKKSSSYLVDDLRRLTEKIGEVGIPDGAPSHLVEDPSDEVDEPPEMNFRGLSTAGATFEGKSHELFFPKPFNDEQVEIIRRLESQPGLVVQGPPGTGKTHTIANVICHYLAQGKRVLVTSKGEAALSVLQQQIPEAIRPLTVSLLTNEREGRDQLENAVNHINSERTNLKPRVLRREIETGEKEIERLHQKIASIDTDLRAWAQKNTSPAPESIGGLDPEVLAREIINSEAKHKWFPDRLDARGEHDSGISNADIESLRDARLELGEQLQYAGIEIPLPADMPSAAAIATIHENQIEGEVITEGIEETNLPRFHTDSFELLEAASKLHSETREHLKLQGCMRAGWLKKLKGIYTNSHINGASSPDRYLSDAIDELRSDIFDMRDGFAKFATTPVDLHLDWHNDDDLRSALERSAKGRRPFPVFTFGRKTARDRYTKVRLNGNNPSTSAEWKKVLEFGEILKKSRELLARWNNLRHQLEIPIVSEDPSLTVSQLVDHAERSERMKLLAVNYNLTFVQRVMAVFPSLDSERITPTEQFLVKLETNLKIQLRKHDLASAGVKVSALKTQLRQTRGEIFQQMLDYIGSSLGNPKVSVGECEKGWQLFLDELLALHEKEPLFEKVRSVTSQIENCGAIEWAERLRQQPSLAESDDLLPEYWETSWLWSRKRGYIESIDGRKQILQLTRDRSEAESSLSTEYESMIEHRTWLGLVESLNDRVSRAIVSYVKAIGAMTRTGRGRRDPQLRRAAQEAMVDASRGIPCWIMPQWRISETLPPDLGVFDLVIIDEASQSDAWAVPALLRGKKVLIVGDDKQVGPNPSFTTQSQIDHLMGRLREADIPTSIYTYLDPKQSIYDLGEIVFAGQTIRLREHFRCAEPIIEFSNKLCYNGEIKCVRVPTATERLLPTLVDVHVQTGYRDKRRKVNKPEASAIVKEIDLLTSDPDFAGRSIGVVSLLGYEQARHIQEELIDQIGEEKFLEHNIRCGDARTFQGSEADIIFISAVDDPDSGAVFTPNRVDNIRRINVAVSRARDRLYFYHSFARSDLSAIDLRGKLMDHFKAPMMGLGVEQGSDLCESDFEREMFEALCKRGYRVIPQVPVGSYRIDMVVEGHKGRRLAIECDGDRYHGPDRWMDDMGRQRVLERAGWKFWRCWGSSFAKDRNGCIEDLVETLTADGIEPIGGQDIDFSGMVDFRSVGPEGEEFVVIDDDADEQPDALAESEVEPELSSQVDGETDEDHGPAVRKKTGRPERVAARDISGAQSHSAASGTPDLFDGDFSDLDLFQGERQQPKTAAQVVLEPEVTGPRVSIEDLVTFCYCDEDNKEIVVCIIDGPSNPDVGHINSDTALAAGLLGAREGQRCEITLPGGKRFARILNVENRL
ncbi:MAG: AAA domain-containing protein [Verrucomicrobiales bacterium]|nr:AAA domain-containing protein [Verrucomicrobiales bacterium]